MRKASPRMETSVVRGLGSAAKPQAAVSVEAMSINFTAFMRGSFQADGTPSDLPPSMANAVPVTISEASLAK